jgi:hypothetical protein
MEGSWAERRDAGRQLHKIVPRSSHVDWSGRCRVAIRSRCSRTGRRGGGDGRPGDRDVRRAVCNDDGAGHVALLAAVTDGRVTAPL